MRARLNPGFAVHAMPFGGAVLADRERLAVVEVDEDVARVVTGGLVVDVDGLPERLRPRLVAGIAEGWLSVEEPA
ncbi:actinodefensin-associated protein B [Actinophytocola oryzae]|uniref:Uncharacterized protein n=1 Tax=Actinophytocola oryzae TaxID=502181 RepID=A0A4R7VL41_9PSEU|nr:actinodefensin-associated protein B [Actinophytocola oryzae]TDV49948.1 hypothetical protein CLV71_107296 [Actinophytocola oryzae]